VSVAASDIAPERYANLQFDLRQPQTLIARLTAFIEHCADPPIIGAGSKTRCQRLFETTDRRGPRRVKVGPNGPTLRTSEVGSKAVVIGRKADIDHPMSAFGV
jgi:hypothetical protein